MKYNFEKIFRFTQISGVISGILGIISLWTGYHTLKVIFLGSLVVFITLSIINVISFLKELWNDEY